MELTMSERKAVTKVLATEHRRASKARKGEILDQISAVTGWHRNHARKALSLVLTIRRAASFARGPANGCASVKVVLRQPGSAQRQTRFAQSRRTGRPKQGMSWSRT
jgi:hypothetical protein